MKCILWKILIYWWMVHYKGTGIRSHFYIFQLENTQMFDKCVNERILFCFDVSRSK